MNTAKPGLLVMSLLSLTACAAPGRRDKPQRGDGSKPYDPYCSGEYNK
ncbi:hypothetical protein [Hydrogenophaga sp. PAMC20947]|nr:hypothetical protein [Hydrogenophaga sp. PAMC20947]